MSTHQNRLKWVAEAYRLALLEYAPDACDRVDELMIASGQRWICSETIIDVNRMMSARDIAEEFGIEAYNVMDWSRRHPDMIPKHKQGHRTLFKLGDVLKYESTRRAK